MQNSTPKASLKWTKWTGIVQTELIGPNKLKYTERTEMDQNAMLIQFNKNVNIPKCSAFQLLDINIFGTVRIYIYIYIYFFFFPSKYNFFSCFLFLAVNKISALFGQATIDFFFFLFFFFWFLSQTKCVFGSKLKSQLILLFILFLLLFMSLIALFFFFLM